MGLTVSPYMLAMDIVLLFVLGYAAFYAITRVSRYGEPLNKFVVIIAASLLLATFGRFLDVVDDLFRVPDYLYSIEELLYFLSILGVIYGVLNYIRAVEKRLVSPPPSGTTGNGVNPGGFVFFGDRDKLSEFLASVSLPVLIFTREPWRYRSLKHVKTIWVTQASEEGVGPTRLHVILDMAVGFLRDGGRLIVLDCVEILVIYNDFVSVFRFLTTLKDYVINAGASLLLHVDESSFEERQLRLLLREFKAVDDPRRLLKTSS